MTDPIGYSACVITTLSSVPQLLKIRKTKSVNDISIFQVSALTLGLTLWLIYAIIKQDYPLILGNIFSIVVELLILFDILKYGTRYNNRSL